MLVKDFHLRMKVLALSLMHRQPFDVYKYRERGYFSSMVLVLLLPAVYDSSANGALFLISQQAVSAPEACTSCCGDECTIDAE